MNGMEREIYNARAGRELEPLIKASKVLVEPQKTEAQRLDVFITLQNLSTFSCWVLPCLQHLEYHSQLAHLLNTELNI